MSTFISRLHSQLRTLRSTGRGAERTAQALGTHKEYPRFPRVELPAPKPLTMPLGEALRVRSSFEAVPVTAGFSREELGTLLGSALGMRDSVVRTYPSGGGLYPVESYLVGTVVSARERAVYHYHPKAHALEHLWDTPQLKMSDIVRTPMTPLSDTLLVFTAIWRRTSAKYGDWAHDHAILEAGHMAQNILLAATGLRLRTRPLLGFDDDTLTTILDLPEGEQPVYGVLLARGADAANDGVYE